MLLKIRDTPTNRDNPGQLQSSVLRPQSGLDSSIEATGLAEVKRKKELQHL